MRDKGLGLDACRNYCYEFKCFAVNNNRCLLVVLQPVIGIAVIGDAVQRFAQPTLFFIAGGFISAVAFETTGLSRRTAYNLAKMSKGDPNKLLFFFMMGAALLSAVFADMVVVIMMMPVAVMLLKNNDCEAGKSNYGKALMIGIPYRRFNWWYGYACWVCHKCSSNQFVKKKLLGSKLVLYNGCWLQCRL